MNYYNLRWSSELKIEGGYFKQILKLMREKVIARKLWNLRGLVASIGANTCVLSHFNPVQLFETLWTRACQPPLSMGFPRQEYWSGLPFPPPGDLPAPGMESTSPAAPVLQADSLPLSHQGSHVNSSTRFNHIYRFTEPPPQLRNRNSPSPRKLPSVTFYGLPSL